MLFGLPVVGQELFEDLIHDGELRQAVLDVFLVRFHAVPAEVHHAVEQAGRLAVLRAWYQEAIRATDASAAARAILGAE